MQEIGQSAAKLHISWSAVHRVNGGGQYILLSVYCLRCIRANTEKCEDLCFYTILLLEQPETRTKTIVQLNDIFAFFSSSSLIYKENKNNIS